MFTSTLDSSTLDSDASLIDGLGRETVAEFWGDDDDDEEEEKESDEYESECDRMREGGEWIEDESVEVVGWSSAKLVINFLKKTVHSGLEGM